MKHLSSKSGISFRFALKLALTFSLFVFFAPVYSQVKLASVKARPDFGGSYYSRSAGITSGTQTLYSYSTVYDNGNSNTPVDVYVTPSYPGATSFSWALKSGYPIVPTGGNGPDGLYFQLGGGYADNAAFTLTAQTPSGPVTQDYFFEISGYAQYRLVPVGK